MYKYDHIAEVILVRQHTAAENNTTLLLEGLTSNFFVIRDDNVLQTAGEHILPGYAREMVLHQARSVVGLEIELESPRMEDCASWKSVFITSSVRLMVPVDKVVVAVVGKNETLKTIWSSASSIHPLFRKLFESVSSAGG
jgi:branched-subunit amino acid aminotransferase/4-amino-4-deoxychorismate lyase